MTLEEFLREITADSQDALGLLDDHQQNIIEILSKQIDKLISMIDNLEAISKTNDFKCSKVGLNLLDSNVEDFIQ